MNKKEALRQFFGHSDFRSGQEEIIDSIAGGCDVLGIMPTGAGKSMCYQIPAMLLPGITLVISPLISLMKDQVGALRQSGIPCAYINSSLSAAEYYDTLRLAEAGEYKLIYVAPERLSAEGFLRFASDVRISLVAVDEAHCVSQWGQDFRPSYMKIPEFIASLSNRPVIAAFTATATVQVRKDICRLLELDSPFTLVTGFDRKNLFFGVRKPQNKNAELLRLVNENSGKSGIIYCSTRKNVEQVCETLIENGISATRYHAGLSDEERRVNQDDFIFDRRQVMVATNAFGMGIDKSNVSFVIHYNMPKNPESYYQEAGRAGRDGEPADCIILYSGADVRMNQYLIDKGNDDNDELSDKEREEIRCRERERLKQMTFYCTTQDCLRGFLLKYFGEKANGCCDNCSNCIANFVETDITLEAQKIISCVYRAAQRRRAFGKTMITDILRGSCNARITESGMNELSTYGIMKDASSVKLRCMLDFLVSQGYLELSDDEYPVLKLTGSSRAVLLGERVIMKQPEFAGEQSAVRKRETHATDDALFEKLRSLRAELAKKQNVPAYFIFSDAVLTCMCRSLPKNHAEFLEVPGVGNAKTERYGDIFISLIREHTGDKSTAGV